MDFISQDTLTLAKVARAWADNPGALPQEEILQRLLDACVGRSRLIEAARFR